MRWERAAGVRLDTESPTPENYADWDDVVRFDASDHSTSIADSLAAAVGRRAARSETP